MFKKIVVGTVFCLVGFVSITDDAEAFATYEDAQWCQKEMKLLLTDFGVIGAMYHKADYSHYPPERGGFLWHAEAMEKMNYLRSAGAITSDAFYALPLNATKQDCKTLSDKMWNEVKWTVEWVQSRDPRRCEKYKLYREKNDCG